MDPKSRNEFSGDSLLDSAWREHFETHPDPAIRKNYETAKGFYLQDMDEYTATSEMRGIAMNRDVELTIIPAGTRLTQWQSPLDPTKEETVKPTGNYFSMAEDRTVLGIQGDYTGNHNRTLEYYYTTKDVVSLRSTSADTENWTRYHKGTYSNTQFEFDDKGNRQSPPDDVLGKQTAELNYGGGTQYYIRREDVDSSLDKLNLTNVVHLASLQERQEMFRETSGSQRPYGTTLSRDNEIEARQDMVADMGGQQHTDCTPPIEPAMNQSDSYQGQNV